MEQEINMHEEIRKINERNVRVTADKAWEVSFFRRGSIALLTYITVVIVLSVSKAQHPYISGIFPPIGYVLSTLSLSLVKTFWIKRWYDKK